MKIREEWRKGEEKIPRKSPGVDVGNEITQFRCMPRPNNGYSATR